MPTASFVWPVRKSFLPGLAALALACCGTPAPPEQPAAVGQPLAACDTAEYYAAWPGARIWVENGRPTPKGAELFAALKQAPAYGGRGQAPAISERSLASAFSGYAADLSSSGASSGIIYVAPELKPQAPCASKLLAAAAAAPSLKPVLEQLDAPNVVARALRKAIATGAAQNAPSSLAADLALARSMRSVDRFILVDTTSARLWAVDGNRVAESMKVVVGKPGSETPAMAALLTYAKLNPYWDIPPDLVRQGIATQAAEQGAQLLEKRGLQAVDRYGPAPQVLNAAAVDWRGVRDGRVMVGVRQLPGPTNMLGRVLFMFPNRQGIYLHDTPGRWAFTRANRHISNGCVRLERADALYRWAFGQNLPPPASAGFDQRVDAPKPVPVFLLPFSKAGSDVLQSLAPERLR